MKLSKSDSPENLLDDSVDVDSVDVDKGSSQNDSNDGSDNSDDNGSDSGVLMPLIRRSKKSRKLISRIVFARSPVLSVKLSVMDVHWYGLIGFKVRIRPGERTNSDFVEPFPGTFEINHLN